MLSYFYCKGAVTTRYSEIPAPVSGREDFSDTKGLPVNRWPEKKNLKQRPQEASEDAVVSVPGCYNNSISAAVAVFKPTLPSPLKMYMNIFIMTSSHMGTCRHGEVK